MDYTSIHIYGHLLSDDILHGIEHDTNLLGNLQQDFGLDISTSAAIDYVWSSLRNDWRFFNERSGLNDPYGSAVHVTSLKDCFRTWAIRSTVRMPTSL